MRKILIGSPIRQKDNILREFLGSLKELNKDDLEVSYFFIDDNTNEKSSILLRDFQKENDRVRVVDANSICANTNMDYKCDKRHHGWKKELILKVASLKNRIIEIAKNENFDYLFFVDSDIVLNRKTLTHLVSRNKEIISNIFWTEWVVGGLLYPQVWMQDENAYFVKDWDIPDITKKEVNKKIDDFLHSMKIPGVYEVGGLGACTLISKNVLKSGVDFSILKNVSFWGEDRHFCIRAESLGYKLYVDTVYPAYHIYREEYINRVQEYKENGFLWDMCKTSRTSNSFYFKIKNRIKRVFRKINLKQMLKNTAKRFVATIYKHKRVVKKDNKIVLSMVVHNEEGKYLKQILEDAKSYVDDILIIDDASTDNTVLECEKTLGEFPHTIVKNEKSLFAEEYKLREKQWKETIKLNPTWILTLDADEIPEKSFKDKLKSMVQMTDVDVFNFKYFDFWNEKQYRSDYLWKAHTGYRPYLVRYQPKIKAKFRKTNQHCGTFPKNISLLKNVNVEVRIKHYGWASKESRKNKYERYMRLDPDGKFGNLDQYKSILDENPNLIDFEEWLWIIK